MSDPGPRPGDPGETILERVARGDRAAVRECLDRYGGLVRALARRWCARPSDADDLVQDVFIALWQAAPRFDPARASEATFVALIARRRLADARRRAQARPAPRPLAEADDPPAPDDAALAAERGDAAARAARALAELPDGPRRVLTMAVRDGLTYDQIARATGLPLGTVKTHARRGLIRLRERLAEAHDATEAARRVEP